ncbi:MAG: sensor domain-containing diguanylate cyclase, partial [Phenylobacterium zucineum]
DEAARQRAVERCGVLDTPPEPTFDRITSLVRRLFGVPMAALSFLDNDRSWLKSADGMDGGDYPRASSFCTHTIQQPRALIVPDTTADPRFSDNPYVCGAPHIASYIGFPIRTPDGFNIGALCAMDVAPRQFTDDQIEGLAELAAMVGEHLALRRIAVEDELTGALSRRAFLEALHVERVRHGRYGRGVSLLMFDVDHFKRVNDTHGHAMGDEVLRAVSACCRQMLRPSDRFGRLGGEEFAIVLPETDPQGALAVAERFREAIAALRVGEAGLQVTASFGVTGPLADEDLSLEIWLAAADSALYAAKHAGRNACRLNRAA